MPDTAATPRWSVGGYARVYPWPQCTYCGRASAADCARAVCLLCGNAQCFGNGSGNGRCGICYYGYLPGWSQSGRTVCGRKGCDQAAVSAAPRIGQVCTGHAATVKIRDRGVSYTLTEFAAHRTAELKAGRLSIGHEVWKLVA